MALVSRRPATAGDAVALGPSGGKFLSASEWELLEAATSRILPSDDGPGAREAHVVAFIDAQLAQRAFAPISNALRTTLQALNHWSQQSFGRPFAALPVQKQDLILSALSTGSIPSANFPQREVFRLLHNLTLEGFLSDPKHGGNFKQVGWRAIGLREL